MPSLPNYLLSHRKRLALSQEEVGFLLGLNGGGKESAVSRTENFVREADLRTAFMYEAIYGRPVRELFAGIREEAVRSLAARAKILRLRKTPRLNPRRDEVVARLTNLND